MLITKYYRRRTSLEASLISRVLKFNFSFNYIGFVVAYNPALVVSLVSQEPHTVGYLDRDGNLVKIDFLEIDSLDTYIVDYGDIQYTENIVKIADNNIPEGGIYYSLEDGRIYNFDCEPEDILQTDRQAAFDCFTSFFSSLKLYRLSNDRIDFREEWDIDMPIDKDRLKFPWET